MAQELTGLSPELERLRRQLDEVDTRIVEELAARQRLVEEVGQLKSSGDDELRDSSREEAMLGRLAAHGRGAGLDGFFVTRLFRDIIDHSIRRQQEHLLNRENPKRSQARVLSVAFQGTEQATGHLAAQRHFGSRELQAIYRGFETLPAMLDAVKSQRADYALLPIENTTAGSINEAYDLLAQMNLAVVGEEVEKIDTTDTEDAHDTYTRFLVVSATPVRCDLRIPCKTSLLFSVRHEEGALLRALNVFATHSLNLTKLESRPRPASPWEYVFYVDFEGNVADPDVEVALTELAAHTVFLKVFGCYPARTTRESRVAEAPSPIVTSEPLAAPAPPSASIVEMLEKKPYRLASRAGRAEDTTIQVGHVLVGGTRPIVIAGPCGVESRDQIFACARIAKELGADMLRGGCFKPRTSPYAFQGMGYEGLDLLEEAGRSVGLPVVTEVLHPADVERVARQANVLQIGARNMQNFALLKEIGRVDRPVMLKRGLMASIDEWLSAAEHIMSQGNQQVILCERGIRTFETATRNTLDLTAIPVVRERTHLPVIVDPSHACGVWRWVTPMAEAALASGAQGVMVEIHPDPSKALSDGPQALSFPVFTELMKRLARQAAAR